LNSGLRRPFRRLAGHAAAVEGDHHPARFAKPSVTVRIGLCRPRTTRSTLRPRSRCVTSADSPAPAEHEQTHAGFLLDQGFSRWPWRWRTSGEFTPARWRAFAQPVQEDAPLFARGCAARFVFARKLGQQVSCASMPIAPLWSRLELSPDGDR
jgi:hypothetical protein